MGLARRRGKISDDKREGRWRTFPTSLSQNSFTFVEMVRRIRQEVSILRLFSPSYCFLFRHGKRPTNHPPVIASVLSFHWIFPWPFWISATNSFPGIEAVSCFWFLNRLIFLCIWFPYLYCDFVFCTIVFFCFYVSDIWAFDQFLFRFLILGGSLLFTFLMAGNWSFCSFSERWRNSFLILCLVLRTELKGSMFMS